MWWDGFKSFFIVTRTDQLLPVVTILVNKVVISCYPVKTKEKWVVTSCYPVIIQSCYQLLRVPDIISQICLVWTDVQSTHQFTCLANRTYEIMSMQQNYILLKYIHCSLAGMWGLSMSSVRVQWFCGQVLSVCSQGMHECMDERMWWFYERVSGCHGWTNGWFHGYHGCIVVYYE